MDMNYLFFIFFLIWSIFVDKGYCDMLRVNVFKYLCIWLCRSYYLCNKINRRLNRYFCCLFVFIY